MAGDCGPTLDVGDYVDDDEIDGEMESLESWGRLFPLGKGLDGIDLVKEEYSFGRGDDCDYCFERNGGRDNPHFRTFSNTHFIIYREIDKNNSDKYVVFLKDKSTNGTFINGEKIGKNKTQVLNNDDEIGLSFKKNKVFAFNDKGESDKNDRLPEDFKQKYTMSKLLGRGACGEVKLAFEKETCKRYAVKIISKKTFSVGPQLGRAAMEEVRIIKSMHHPCIIRVEDLFESSDALYIVLELVEGGELFDRVVGVGKFSERIGKLLFYQMLVAVKYLHDRGITHRDLKPENILLASDDEETLIKVTDFGLSKFVGEQSLMKTLCGTPSYLAPEIIKSAGIGGYNKAVDCWSLGVILYIMLGGYPPFSNEITEYSLEDQICNARFSFPKDYWKDVTSEATDLISKLLTVDADKRISTAEALNHPWMKDTSVIKVAENLMSLVADKQDMMPPPSLPGRKHSLSDDESNQMNKRMNLNIKSPSKPDNKEPLSSSPRLGDKSNGGKTGLCQATSTASTCTLTNHSSSESNS